MSSFFIYFWCSGKGALSIHPELKDLWFLAGITASKQKDWRSARFCFGHCDDDIRKLEALILVNFCEQNFLECTFTLNKLFNIYPKHEFGLFIYSFISKSFPLWKEFLSNKNLEKEEEIKIEEYKFRHILNKFEQLIKTNNSNNSTQFGLFSSVLNKLLPKFAPLKIKLRNDMRMEDIGICLCNIFDRIEQFSSVSFLFYNIFIEDGTKWFAEQKIIFYMDNTTNNNTQEAQQNNLMQIDEVQTDNNVNNIPKNVTKEKCNGTLRDIEIIEEKQSNYNKSKDEYFNGNNKLIKLNKKRILNWAEKFTKLMRLANNSLQNRTLDPLINYRWIEDLPNFNPLIEAFVEASKNENWEFSQYLYKFLQFICEKKNVGLTLGQAEIFRQVYIRWSSTFLSLSLDNTQQTIDLLIHQMAAELGSHRALSILQLFFDGELNFNNNKNMRPPKLNTQKEKEVAEINFDKNKLNKNQLDLFKWIFERIANEQKEEKLKDKPEGTDIIGETTSTDTQNNSSRISFDRTLRFSLHHPLELTSNLQPNELGLLLQQQSSESIHFAYIYCQLKIALNLIINSENGNNVKIFTNANFGINCLSKRNLEEFLKKKVGEYEI
uniref:Integrator complex subunit 10 n=1 Tax=Meloidogyne floridensis TaxID=298350 RepID=A0A915NDB3_9BILA